MTDASPPPIDPEIDLRDFQFMPLLVSQLLTSDTWLISSGDEAKAAVTLWCRAWHQVPAGSLPDDDRLLAGMSGAGAKWKRVRDVALRGFERASDGRLYHAVICDAAKTAWKKKSDHRNRTKAASESRRKRTEAASSRSEQVERNDNRDGHRNDQRDDGATINVTSTKGQGQGQGEKKESYPEKERFTISRATRLIEIFDRVRTEIFGAEHTRPWPQSADAVHAQRAIEAGWTEHAAELLFRDRMAKRREQDKPPPGGLAWFEKPFAEASPAARTAEDVSDDDPRAKAFVAAASAWLDLDPEARRKTPRPTREAFGLPPTPEASP